MRTVNTLAGPSSYVCPRDLGAQRVAA